MMGAYLNNPVVPHQETNINHARELAKILGCNGNLQDDKNILTFLKKQDPVLLIDGFRRCQLTLQEVPTQLKSILRESPKCLIN